MQYVISSDSKLGSQSNSPIQHPQNTHPSLPCCFQSSILQPPEWPLLSRARIAHNCFRRVKESCRLRFDGSGISLIGGVEVLDLDRRAPSLAYAPEASRRGRTAMRSS
jgi:hypothetical protein